MPYNYGSRLRGILESMGGGTASKLGRILERNAGESYLSGFDPAGIFGMRNLRDLLSSGNITAEGPRSFLQSIFDYTPGSPSGSPGGGEGGGGGGHGGGFTGGPEFNLSNGAIDLTALPNYGLINSSVENWLSGDKPLEMFPIADPLGNMRGGIESTIDQLLQAEGLPDHIMEAARNTIQSRLKARERDQVRTSGERAAGRGIEDSGLLERAIREIQEGTDQTLAENLSNLELMNAREAAGQRQIGISAADALGRLGLGQSSLGLQGGLGERGQDLQALSTALGGLLGLGNLGLENVQTDLQRQLEEFRMGLLANSLFSSGEGSGVQPTFDLSSLLSGDFLGGGSGGSGGGNGGYTPDYR